MRDTLVEVEGCGAYLGAIRRLLILDPELLEFGGVRRLLMARAVVVMISCVRAINVFSSERDSKGTGG